MKKTAFLIMIITILSKIMGFIRDLVLSYYYGASNISDAYLISLTIPGVVFSLIGIGIANGFIPIYSQIESENDKESADDFTSNFANIILLISSFIFIFGIVFTEQIVKLFASGFSGDVLSMTITFTRITLFGIFATGMTYIFKGYLQLKNNFLIPAMIGLPLNIITIIAIVISAKVNIKILAIGSLIATVSQFIFMIPSIKNKGYKHKIKIDLKDENIKKIMIIVLPIVIGSSVDQINILVDRTLASNLAIGGISSMNYANKLNQFVNGLFVLSIVTVMYPQIAKLSIKKEKKILLKMIKESILIITVIITPISVISMLFSKEIVSILFQRGSFDNTATVLTSNVLFFLSLGMLGFALREVLTRVFYAIQDTKTPVINASIAVALNIILNIILSRYLGVPGLALATSISVVFCTLLLSFALVKKLKIKSISYFLIDILKIILIAIFMGFIINKSFNFINNFMSSELVILVSVIIGLLIYIILIFLFKILNYREIRNIIKK